MRLDAVWHRNILNELGPQPEILVNIEGPVMNFVCSEPVV